MKTSKGTHAGQVIIESVEFKTEGEAQRWMDRVRAVLGSKVTIMESTANVETHLWGMPGDR